LPRNGVAVKTSTVWKRWRGMQSP